MSGPWWGKDVDPRLPAAAAEATLDATSLQAPVPVLPALTTTDAAQLRAELDGRRAGFTPTWTSRSPDDPGNALIAVYAEQHAALADEVVQLEKRARVEYLRAAGVLQRPPRPLATMLQFEVSPSATGGVLVGAGFEVLGRDAVTGELVPFETTRDLFAAPATIAVLGRRKAGSVISLPIPKPGMPARVLIFGAAPEAGIAMYLGLDALVAPTPAVAIGVTLAPRDGAPPPVSAGGLFPQPGTEPPRLAWELFVGGRFVAAEVKRDDTHSFTQSGVVELGIPDGWQPGTPPGTDQPLYWIRSQLLDGAWSDPPAIAGLALNVVPALSGRTVRDEIIDTPISPDPDVRRVLVLANHPVLEGTLDVRIDEGDGELTRWEAVDDLSTVEPDARAFRFDPATGVLTFASPTSGRGLPLPEGFRHVHATYRVATTATKVIAGAISTLVGSAPFLTSVTNADAAAGGLDVEDLDTALVRGPREIRARERAVAPADYEVRALHAPGADLRRAHAVGNFHPRFPGAPIPGVVAVFVVGAPHDDGTPPIPTDATLQETSEYLSRWAPRGAEVVAVSPTFHTVRVEATLEIARDADVTAAVHRVSQYLDDELFHPLRWPFGGTLEYDAIVRSILRAMPQVLAVPQLRFVVDGIRHRHCEDVAIGPHDLLWPVTHELVPLPRTPT